MQIGAIEMQNGSPIDMFIHKINIKKNNKNSQTHSLLMNPKNTPLGLYLDFPSKVNMKIFL